MDFLFSQKLISVLAEPSWALFWALVCMRMRKSEFVSYSDASSFLTPLNLHVAHFPGVEGCVFPEIWCLYSQEISSFL